MELTNVPHLASSSSFIFSSCTCRNRRTGKALIRSFAAGSRCSADSSCSEPIAQQNVDPLSATSGPANTHCYRRRDFAAVALLPFILPHVDTASAAEPYDGSVIQNGVRNVLTKVKAAGVLRLVFHDAGTFDIGDKSGGMNGSIIYEVDRPENTGLSKPLKILRKAKEGIDQVQQVSWADLIAVAGAEAVALCGGPEIPVRLGRLDSSTADPIGKLPEETLDIIALKTSFGKKGFSIQEMVVLSGAHTIGGKGFGNPNAFDNTYFKILLEKPQPTSSGMPIGLPTDWALTKDDECLRWINIYAEDQAVHITWGDNGDREPCLDIDVNLEVNLEVYTKPFSLLPLSAVEKPGNLLMQGLLDRPVPLLGEQLLKDYHWVQKQPQTSP